MTDTPDPTFVAQTLSAFWASQVLLTAVQFDLFTLLGDGAMKGPQIEKAMGLHPRATYDFLDSLVAMKILDREGDGSNGRYKNTPDSLAFLDRRSETYIGGLAEMFKLRLWNSWNKLDESLKTGKPATLEAADGEKGAFDKIYGNPATLVPFLDAMDGFQRAPFTALAEKFDFSPYKTVTDVGGALALLSRLIAAKNPHLTATSFDLPQVTPHAYKYINAARLRDQVAAVSGDFFVDPLPSADVITMGNILHDWDLEHKMFLIKKAYDVLPEGGALIVVESIIDNERRTNVPALLLSLNMLIEMGPAFNFSDAEFRNWCEEIGFKRFESLHLIGDSWAAIAFK